MKNWILLCLLCFTAASAAHADFSQTMRAFGRQMLHADLLGQSGSADADDVAEAVQGLKEAIQGADLLIGATCQNNMLPSKVSQFETVMERDTYSQSFIQMMKAFRSLLVEYRELVEAPTLDYEALAQKRTQIKELAHEAHSHL